MTHHHSMTALTLSLVAVLLSTLGVSPTSATDDKIYPGAMCVRYDPFGGNPPKLSLSFGAINNPSASFLYLNCPVIHDSISHSIGSASMQVIDQHPNTDVSCTLHSVHHPGTSYFDYGLFYTRKSAGSSSSPQTLSFERGLESNSLSHYYFHCVLPPAVGSSVSSIISYRVNEND